MMPEVPNIALRAYQLWDSTGRPEGRSEEFFFQADHKAHVSASRGPRPINMGPNMMGPVLHAWLLMGR
jgi:hypothetical protein